MYATSRNIRVDVLAEQNFLQEAKSRELSIAGKDSCSYKWNTNRKILKMISQTSLSIRQGWRMVNSAPAFDLQTEIDEMILTRKFMI